MKSMKLFISVITLILFTSSAMAQHTFSDNKKPEERAKEQTEWMKKELSLDSTLVEKVHIINLKYANKIENLKNSNAGRRQKFQEFSLLSSDKDSELKKIFTKGQYKAYQKKKNKMRNAVKSKYQGNQF